MRHSILAVLLGLFAAPLQGGEVVKQAANCATGTCATRTYTTVEPVLVPAKVVTTYTVNTSQEVVLEPVVVESRPVKRQVVRFPRLRLFAGACCR